MSTKISDEELLYQIRQNDETAWKLLIERYEKFIYPMAVSIMRFSGFEDDQDALQVAMMGFIKAVECYRPERKASFHSFARLCARRELANELRRRCRSSRYSGCNDLSLDSLLCEDTNTYRADQVRNDNPEFQPEENFNFKLLNEQINKSVSRMPENYQTVFNYWKDGYSYQEIADKTGMNVKTVDAVIQKIKKSLRKQDFVTA